MKTRTETSRFRYLFFALMRRTLVAVYDPLTRNTQLIARGDKRVQASHLCHVLRNTMIITYRMVHLSDHWTIETR